MQSATSIKIYHQCVSDTRGKPENKQNDREIKQRVKKRMQQYVAFAYSFLKKDNLCDII